MTSLTSVVSIEEFISWQKYDNSHSVKTVKVLYTSMNGGPAVLPDIVKKHPNTYIPNSIGFDFQVQFSDQSSELSNMMISAAEFSQQASLLGLENDDTIVIYDDFGNFCASRVWFMFKSMGHKNVCILDGGLPLYLEMELPTSTTLNPQLSDNENSRYACKPNAAFAFVDQDYILANLETANATVADARSSIRFLGKIPETKEHVRAGRIPLSVNIHYANLQDSKGRFLSTAMLKNIFAPYSQKPLIFTCGSGVTACILAQAATIAGADEVKVYDGSWSQWGANANLPIQVGDE